MKRIIEVPTVGTVIHFVKFHLLVFRRSSLKYKLQNSATVFQYMKAVPELDNNVHDFKLSQLFNILLKMTQYKAM